LDRSLRSFPVSDFHVFQQAAKIANTLSGTAKTATPSLGKIKIKYNDGSDEERTSNDELAFVTAEIISAGFSGDHKYTEWSTKTAIDAADSDPIWKKIASPDKPVIYTKSAKPTAFATFKLEPKDAPASNVTLKVEMTVIPLTTVEVAKKLGVAMSPGPTQEFSVAPIAFSEGLSGKVEITKPPLAWSLSLDEAEGYFAAGSSTITFYWTHGTPTTSPLYDLGPQKACGYIAGNTDYAARCNKGIESDVWYDPAELDPPTILEVYDKLKAQCSGNALLLQYILKSIGADGRAYASKIRVTSGGRNDPSRRFSVCL
jgi:hypothetical protein